MQEKHLYEYAIIRVVPRVEREEFINVGVIVYCPSKRFLQTVYELNEKKLLSLYNELDISEIEDRLKAFVHICEGDVQGGPIGKLPLASRFRWLTAARSTIVQTSPVHPGLCVDPQQALAKLHRQFVL
jgi:hypothetical protein